MNYFSTRDASKQSISASAAIKQGLANDGGLFVPETIPSLTKEEILDLCNKSYAERAATVLSKFLTDYTYDELLADCEEAYSEASFPGWRHDRLVFENGGR